MFKLLVIIIVIFESILCSPQKFGTTSNIAQSDDIFDYLFGWLFDYDSDEDYDFNNKNVTSEFNLP